VRSQTTTHNYSYKYYQSDVFFKLTHVCGNKLWSQCQEHCVTMFLAFGSFFFSFFLSWEAKPQLTHWTNKRVVSTQWIVYASRGEDRGGVVIWWKTCWHKFFRGKLREKLLLKLDSFEKFWSLGEKEARTGWRIVDRGPQMASRKPYSLDQSYFSQHNALR